MRAEHPGASVRHITWQLRLAGSVQDLGDSRADLLVTLRTLTGDRSLNLLDVEPGSVILTLEGSEEGYRVLRSLGDSGQLR